MIDTVTSVDAQLHEIAHRRHVLLDQLAQCLIDLDTLANRTDVLLERRKAVNP